MSNTSRNYGIDLLRVIAILGVVCLHVLGHGGLLKQDSGFINFSLLWGLELFAYPAVNCFVIISGFVGFRSGKAIPNFKSFFSIFFTAVFYAVLITAVFKFLHPEAIGNGMLLRAFFPIGSKQYWFFTAYAGMFLLSPVLNLAIDSADRKTLKFFCFVVIGFFSIYGTLAAIEKGDIFGLSEGYGVFWFALLYLLGGAIKKLDLQANFDRIKCISGLLICFILGIGTKVFCQYWILKTASETAAKYRDIFVSYCSPTVLLSAVFLVIFFSSLDIRGWPTRFISFLSSSAFSVYLIHDNLYVRSYVIKNSFLEFLKLDRPSMLVSVLASVFGIFFICIFIDKIRIGIFKLLKIETLSSLLSGLISKKTTSG